MAEDFARQNFVALKNKSFQIKFELGNSRYKAIENIGNGAYGVVCSAEHVLTKTKVAIKKIPDIFEQPTIAKRTYREIKILKHFKHDNIIAIRDILKPPGDIENLRDVYMVFDLMETDMHRIIHSKQEITDEHVRYFLYQILRGLKYIHSANVIHRDLKPSNLLVNENCDVKIGDFGMARGISSNPNEFNLRMTQYVATRWYRAPELLIDQVAYTGAVDMWSVGCIFAEMLGRTQIFPGKDHFHQLKLIIGIMGSPPAEFLQLTQYPAIRNIITGWGVKKPVPLEKLYPKAPMLAIDLLTKILAMNPKKRISVECALSHPFLKNYHDPQDEPVCVPAFDFSFEKKDMTPEELKSAIIKEILDYHPVSEKPKIAFDFRPVPRSEINQKLSPKKKSPGAKADTFASTDKEANFGLNAFLTQIRTFEKKDILEGQENKPQLKQQQQKVREFSSSGQPLSFLSTNSPKSEFKVPVGLPQGKDEVQVKQEDEDVVMLSAKSSMKVETDVKPVTDVEMPSAGRLGQTDPAAVGPTVKTEVKVEEEPDKSFKTKEVLKAAILNAALRKQKGDTLQKQRPMTALQKQRQREEKKQRKVEKAMERKKRQKKKAKENQGITLSDEDKNLLERWTTMQQRPLKHTATAGTAGNVGVVTGESAQLPPIVGTSTTSVTFNSSSKPQKPSATESQAEGVPESSAKAASLSGVLGLSQESCGQTLRGSQVKAFTDVQTSSNPQQTSVHSSLPSCSLPGLAFQESYSHVPELVKTDLQADPGQSKQSQVIDLTHEPQAESVNAGVNLHTQQLESQFTETSQDYDYSLPSLSPLDSDMKSGGPMLDDILNQLMNGDSPGKLPPTYSEAMQGKLPTLTSVQNHVDPPKSGTTCSKDVFLPFQTYQPGDPALQSVYATGTQLNDNNPSTSVEQNTGSGRDSNMLSIITRQMMRSHMEDLTLTKTPKGTGGTGYGVGTDLESLMEEAAKDVPMDRSAPLSATESLIGDWLEVSGMKGLDSKEYEALERELGLGSPINIHDIVTSPS